ncbi:MAG: flagellar motor protein [Bdellovibrionaceae bacterium]|nr:flagellar motor protein [Pseudobdellovibrionaceae bacterium]
MGRSWQNDLVDKSTIAGILVGIGGIVVGNALEGGHFSALFQFTAFLIVMSGTLGAVLVSSSPQNVKKGLKMLPEAFREEDDSKIRKLIREIVDCTLISKKDGVLALEERIKRIEDPFFRKVVRSVIDGIDPKIIRETYEIEIDAEEEELLSAVKIWSDAGGFAPTIGILGAVLGLIHVMSNLTDTSKLGAGIAVAFVATVYGVGFANLVFLPIANKLKRRVLRHSRNKRIILDGAILINSGLSSVIVGQKLEAQFEGEMSGNR